MFATEYYTAQARKSVLERRKDILWRGMEANGERDAQGLRSDRWEQLADLYDRCDDEIAECDKIIDAWEEEHPERDEIADMRRWYHARVL